MARSEARAGRGAAWILAAAVSALLSAACGPADPQREPAAPGPEGRGGTIVFAESAEPRTLDCVRAADGPSLRVCRLLFDTLVAYGRGQEIVPRLAASHEVSPDGRTVTFRLRPGVRWHDGAPLTSRDVLHTADRLRDPRSGILSNLPALFEPLESIEAPDDLTVVARYREPYALAYQAWARAYVAPAHLASPTGGTAGGDRAPIGTGPFVFERWDPQERIVLRANGEYFDGPPRADRFIYEIVPDSRTLELALRTGRVDVAGLPPDLVPVTGGEPVPYEVRRYPGLSLSLILWNLRERPGLFGDPRVRRAMSLALDRRAFVERITGGNDLPAVSTFPPGSWAHDPALEPLPHDPEQAAALLAEAGWRDRNGDGILDTERGPASFSLIYRAGDPMMESIAVLMHDAARRLGVEVRIQGLEWKALLAKVQGHEFDAAVYRWGLDVDPDPFDFFHSSQAARGQNYGAYANPEVDRLSEEGRRTLDLRGRAALYHRVERILRDEQPYTFISHPHTVLGVSRRIRGLEVGTGTIWWHPGPLLWWAAGPAPSGP